MKKKNFNKKLSLNKETMAVLNNDEMVNVQGGSSWACVWLTANIVAGAIGLWGDRPSQQNAVGGDSDVTCIVAEGGCLMTDVQVYG